MTRFAQSKAVRNIHQLFQHCLHVVLVGVDNDGERNDVMGFNSKVDGFGEIIASSAVTAPVAIASKNIFAPLGVLRSLTKRIGKWCDATFPVPMIRCSAHALAPGGPSGSFGLGIMSEVDVLRDAAVKVTFSHQDRRSAATLTKVFASILFNKLSFLLALGMVTRISADYLEAFNESTVVVALRWFEHWCIIGNSMVSVQEKSGELLETLPGDAEGNQQPSAKYTSRRFRDYRRGTDLLITGSVPGPFALGMI